MTALPPGFVHAPGWYTGPAIIGTMTRELPWNQETLRIYGREVKVPRLTAWMGDADYTYSGVLHQAAPMHPIVQALRELLQVELGCEFNSCLANLYRGGSDSVSWHSDDEPELGPEPLIASLSFGASRLFKIRAARCPKGGARPTLNTLTLGDGDLVVMSGRAQLDYLHMVPKAVRAEPRINLTFRHIP